MALPTSQDQLSGVSWTVAAFICFVGVMGGNKSQYYGTLLYSVLFLSSLKTNLNKIKKQHPVRYITYFTKGNILLYFIK